MIRAAAKNYLRVASVVNPEDYGMIISEMKAGGGVMSLELRFRLAQKAFLHTAAYDRMIAEYLNEQAFEDVRKCYQP